MTEETETLPDESTFGVYPAIEHSYNKRRHEFELLIRRPFYMDLRLGLTQCALWVGKGYDCTPTGRFHTVFNFLRNSWQVGEYVGHVADYQPQPTEKRRAFMLHRRF